MAVRWKVKPKGFATVKQGGWWVRPGTAGGGTPSTQTRTGARNSLVPREWVGSEGLIGNWARAPRLDPTKFETLESDETGRWWARPITELTGLSPSERGEVRRFDEQTAGQTQRIDQSFADFVAQAGQNAQQGNEALQGLTGIMGSGYGAADPTGQVLSAAARQATGAGVAPIMADLTRMPGIAREAGTTASGTFAAERLGQRTELIQGYHKAAAEAEQAERDRAAELRGQELSHLGRLAGFDNQLQLEGLRGQRYEADRASRERIAGQNLTSQERRAQLQAETRLRVEEAKQAKQQGRKPPTANTIRAWAKRAREMWDGVPRTITGEDGRSRTEYLQYDGQEILRELMAQGATRARAVRIVRQITGQPNFGKPLSAASRQTVRNIF